MRNPVTCKLLNFCLVGALAVLPLVAAGAVVAGDDESCERVEGLLQAGISARGVVGARGAWGRVGGQPARGAVGG
jgi:hypothetical protein